MAAPLLHDLSCVVHLHSLYSDGTGTVAEIAAAGRKSGADVVLLTDHDTLEAKRRGEERWYGSTLLLVGEEVSPVGENHFLAFGLEEPIEWAGMSAADICAAVAEAGGFGFAAHPFSSGSERFRRFGDGQPWRDLDDRGLTGIELWSFLVDTAEALGSVTEVLRFLLRPGSVLRHPPRRNLVEWDRMCAVRPVVALGGIDAHQVGKRIGDRVPLRLMGYARSFRHLRTHVLTEQAPTGEVARDRDQVYAALRTGRCYLAVDSLAPPRGFTFWAKGAGGTVPMGAEEPAGEYSLNVRAPRTAALRLLRDGREVAWAQGAFLEHRVEEPGAYRVEARLHLDGGPRTWIVSNPIYLR